LGYFSRKNGLNIYKAMEKKNNILLIANLFIILCAFGFFYAIYSGLSNVSEKIDKLEVKQIVLENDLKIHNFNDSIFQHGIINVARTNSQNINTLSQRK
jgi:hypothetical protein